MKTKAAVLYAIGEPLVIEELELEAPRENEILIRCVASGICHSDYSIAHGVLRAPMPIVLGHEGAGIVEQVGPGVTHLKPGDKVIGSLTPSCGECAMCKEHKHFMCVQMGALLNNCTYIDGTTRHKTLDGEDVYAMCGLASFGSHMVMPAGSAIKVPDDTALESTCLIGCGVTTGAGAALNTVKIKAGDAVAVVGCGGVGLSIIQGARIAGATTIIAIDPIAEKRQLALDVGATHALDPTGENVVKQVRKMTGGGVHFAFEALGRKETIEQAWAMPRVTGTAVIVGVPKKDTMLDLPVLGFFGEKHFKGSAYGSSVPSRDIPKYVDLFMSGELKLDAMITRRIALEQVNEALDQMGRGEGARSVIGFD